MNPKGIRLWKGGREGKREGGKKGRERKETNANTRKIYLNANILIF